MPASSEVESKRSPKSRKKDTGFYVQALTEAERVRLPKAKQIEGLDEEIALLRVKLRSHLEKHPENLEVLMKGISLLLRAVVAKYKLSPQAEEDLYANVMGVVKGIGGMLLPEEFGEKG